MHIIFINLFLDTLNFLRFPDLAGRKIIGGCIISGRRHQALLYEHFIRPAALGLLSTGNLF